MVNTRGIARLGMLAVGLGIGAAVAHTPVASADSTTDPFSWLAGLGDLTALPAQSSGLDLAISFDGISLFQEGNATAITVAGQYGFAIADGDDAIATADGGIGDYASASGPDADAEAGDADAGATGNNFDYASATGTDSGAFAGNDPDVCVTVGITCPDSTGSSFDSASANSGTTSATGVGADASAGYNGSGDSANAVGQETDAFAGLSSTDTPANDDYASVLGNVTTPTEDTADAGSFFVPFGGSNDTAFVVDPVGTLGSSAGAGDGFNFDLAGVFGDDLNALANTANDLVTILPSL
jgi:hypothetical protein